MSISFIADNFYINGKKLEDILTKNKDKKMYTIDTDIINGYDNGQQITEEAHKMLLNKGCPEDWFLKREFEVGDWVVCINERHIEQGEIGRLKRNDGHHKYPWYADGLEDCHGENHLRPATPEEIKDHLTEEAKKRGFVMDARFRTISVDEYVFNDHYRTYSTRSGNTAKVGNTWAYGEETDTLAVTGYGNYAIYHKGEWAEPIDTTLDIEINGYKSEFHDDYVQFGCAKIGAEMFTELNKFLNREFLNYGNKQIEAVKIGKGEFTLDQIKQIAKYYQ